MPIFISPSGNSEIWKEKPIGYYTPEEWQALNYSAEKRKEEERLMRVAEINYSLDLIDIKSIMLMRDNTLEDIAELAELRQESLALRAELKNLGEPSRAYSRPLIAPPTISLDE